MVRYMARRWSGFLPQNLCIKEEWELLETCEAQARLAEKLRFAPEEPKPHTRRECTHRPRLRKAR